MICVGGVEVVAMVGPIDVALQLVGAKRSVGVISVVVEVDAGGSRKFSEWTFEVWELQPL